MKHITKRTSLMKLNKTKLSTEEGLGPNRNVCYKLSLFWRDQYDVTFFTNSRVAQVSPATRPSHLVTACDSIVP